jgi:SulP family sulfate permease
MGILVEEAQPKVIAIDLSCVSDLEYTALKMLINGEKRFRERGIAHWLVGMNPSVIGVVQSSQLAETLGRDAMHFKLEIAVAEYLGEAGHSQES